MHADFETRDDLRARFLGNLSGIADMIVVTVVSTMWVAPSDACSALPENFGLGSGMDR
jgi:hypothetical protein